MTDKRKKPPEQAVEADVEQAATPVEGEDIVDEPAEQVVDDELEQMGHGLDES